MRGRFAPSPTGSLHLGNLRTALVAWLMARKGGGGFIVRMEDLDRVTSSPLHEADQLAALGSIGLDWDGEVVRQSERFALYLGAIARLRDSGLVYECYCTRREIRLAAEAPHSADPDGRYPGTCRGLTEADRDRHREAGRRPALRLVGDGREESFDDRFCGRADRPGRRLRPAAQRRSAGLQPGRGRRRRRAGGDRRGPRRRPDCLDAPSGPAAPNCSTCPSRGTHTCRLRSHRTGRGWPSGMAR